MRTALVAVVVMTTSCSLIQVKTAPRGAYRPIEPVECTEGNGWPVFDAVLGAMLIGGGTAVALASDKPQIGAAVPSWILGAVEVAFAIYGFNQTALCRDALEYKKRADRALNDDANAAALAAVQEGRARMAAEAQQEAAAAAEVAR